MSEIDENVDSIRDAEPLQKVHTLGSVRIATGDDKKIICVPTPSNDPNDPLSWSKRYRYYVAALTCVAIFVNNFVAAGPTVAIVTMTIDFFGPPGPTFLSKVGKTSYFFTITSLAEGIAILFWMPLVIKYGRRQSYVISIGLYAIFTIWAAVAKSYASEFTARFFIGLMAGAGLVVAPLTITDLTFLHERGTIMAWYSTSLVAGGTLGQMICGLMTRTTDWRSMYWVATGLMAFIFVLIVFTMPETSFDRSLLAPALDDQDYAKNSTINEKIGEVANVETVDASGSQIPARKTYRQMLSLYNGPLVQESMFKIFVRPLGFFIIPPIFWATLCVSLSVGFVIAISTNWATAFATVYGFETWQIALTSISPLVGSVVGIFVGGNLSDYTATFFSLRNGGIREPEMRLPALTICLFTEVTGLMLYGVGIQKQIHWMLPTVALALIYFTCIVTTNIVLVYAVDAYRPVAGEVIVAIMAFKGFISFILSFYTNPWIEQQGYLLATGEMSAIAAAILLCWIPFYFFGKKIRHSTLEWKVFSWIQWADERETGE